MNQIIIIIHRLCSAAVHKDPASPYDNSNIKSIRYNEIKN